MTAIDNDSWGAFRGNEHLIGQRLGRYLVSSRLGHGGMAEVFRASDEKLDREVAIKVVLPAYASDPQLLQRFLREARVVASLDHPNILPIYDFGDHEGLPYLVLPLIRGGTLADVLEDRRLDPARIAGWVRELAQALDAAHSAGVLHRDVKPGNVLVGRDEHLFLTDFGIARLNDATRLTRTGTVVGTPVYMAPEVAAGKSAEAASDLYSLAVMSYEMLAGRAPFEGENALSILHQHATSPVPPITGHTDHLAPGVDQVFEQGMAKRPGDRPSSCRAFADLLAVQLPSTGLAGPPSDLVPTLAMAQEPTVAPAMGSSSISSPTATAYATVDTSAASSRNIPRWLVGGLLVAMVAWGGFWAFQRTDRELPPSTQDHAVVALTSPDSAPLNTPSETPTEPSDSEPTADFPPSVEPPATEPPSTTGVPTAPPPAAPPIATPEPAVASATGADFDPRSNRLRFNAMRSFNTRWTENDFSVALEASRRLPGRGPAAVQGKIVEAYARGGLAYLAGQDGQAGEALGKALQDPRLVKFWGPGPLMLLASERDRSGFEAWELALGYGDARGSAAGLLEPLLLEHPEDARLRVARALIHRLDDEHTAVIRNVVPVFEQLSSRDAPEARSYLAQIVGDAYLALDRGEEALDWYRRAFDSGGSFQGFVALRGAEAALELRRPDLMKEFLEQSCQNGFQPACRRLQSGSRRSRN